MSATVTGTFLLIDRASGPLKRIEEQAKKTDDAIAGLGDRMDNVGTNNQMKQYEKVGKQLRDVERQAKDTGKGMESAADGTDKYTKSTERAARSSGIFGRRMLMLAGAAGALLPVVIDLAGALGALVGSLGAATLGVGALGTALGGALLVGLAGVAGAGLAAKKEMKGLKDELKDLQGQWENQTKAGQADFVGMLADSMKRAEKMLPMLADSSNRSMKAMRGAVDNFFERLDSPVFGKFIESMTTLWEKVATPLSNVLANVGKTLAQIAIAAAPFTDEFVDGLVDWTRGWVEATENTGKLRKSMDGWIDQAKSWKDLLGATWDLTVSVFGSGKEEGQGLVDDMTRKLKQWNRQVQANPKGMNDFWAESIEGTKELMRLIGSFRIPLKNLNDAMEPIVSIFERLVSAFNKIEVPGTGISALTGIVGLTLAGKGASRLHQAVMGTRWRPMYVKVVNSLTGWDPEGGGGGGSKGEGKGRGTPPVVAGGGKGGAKGGGAGGAAEEGGRFGRLGTLGRVLGRVGSIVSVGLAAKGFLEDKGDFLSKGENAFRQIDITSLPNQILGTKLPTATDAVHQQNEMTRNGSDPGRHLAWTAIANFFNGLDGTGPKLSGAAGRRAQRRVDGRGPGGRSGAVRQGPALDRADDAFGLHPQGPVGAPAGPGGPMGGPTAGTAPSASWKNMWQVKTAEIKPEVKSDVVKDLQDIGKKTEKTNKAIGDDTRKRFKEDVRGSMVNQVKAALPELVAGFSQIRQKVMKALSDMGFSPSEATEALKGGGTSGNGGGSGNAAAGGGGHSRRGSRNATGGRLHFAGGGRLGGIGNQDKVHMGGGNIGAPGELVVNQHTEADVDRDLIMAGKPPLGRRVAGENRPHYMAKTAREKHFAGGGRIVPMPGFPGEQINSSIVAPTSRFLSRYHLTLTDAYGPGHESPEHTQYGTAIDVVPGPGGSWDSVAAAAYAAVRMGWTPVGYDGTHGTEAWPGHGPPSMAGGNAHAHITVLSASEQGQAPGRIMGGAGGGGGGGGGVPGINVKAPKTKLKGIGGIFAQRGMDIMARGANKKVNKRIGAMGGGGGPGAMGGGAVSAQIYRVLSANGWNKIGAAGVIGNAYAESSLDPTADDGAGNGGLWGFTASPNSFSDLKAWAGNKWANAAVQTRFLLEHVAASTRANSNRAGSPEAAAEVFMNEFERPGIPRLDVRQAAARRAFQQGYAKGGRIPGTQDTRTEWGGWFGRGGSGMVHRPTLIGVGDGGSEHVSITPAAKMGKGGGGGTTINTGDIVVGTGISEKRAREIIEAKLAEAIELIEEEVAHG